MKAPRNTVALLVAAIFVVSGLLVLQWSALNEARRQVERTLVVIEKAQAAHAEIIGAETAQRGFVITQDETFARAFEAAQLSALDGFASLEALMADNPSQIARLQKIRETWQMRVARLRGGVELAREGRLTEARDGIRAGVGSDLMASVRAEVGAAVREEQKMLAGRLEAATRAETIARGLILAVIGLAAASFIFAVRGLNKDNRRLSGLVEEGRRASNTIETARAELAVQMSKTQLQLNDASRRLAAAVSNAPIFVWNQDRDLVYRWFSGKALGRTPDYFVGRSDHEVLPDNIRSTVVANNQAVLETGEPRTYELSFGAGGKESWFDVRVEATRDAGGEINGLTGVAVDITDRKKREQNIRFLMREIAHRSKNILAVVQAMARQTAASNPDPKNFIDRFAARLEALGATHALLVDDSWEGAELSELIRSQMGHQLDLVGKQIFISGPPLSLPAEMAQNIGMALHELATNAAKYGALSVPEGRVDVEWTAERSPEGGRDVILSWRESGGPSVAKPSRRGFGQIVIERTVSRAVGGTVEMGYEHPGFSWTLRFRLKDDSSNEEQVERAEAV